ncbi:curli assembly protein CsgE [Leminorella grimontii]|uniref:Curli production assembly/transport component CsgE n=1 Tax=Leminorella grimontii TaxID=82981 RepID=A0AAV5N758_9GAMM|nr:curli production assembly/transport protein CsgE [Leminorella grimontii]KFC95180.1 CsgE family curli production assembly/transport component [Leminorella grimontii ATCC 33999 = DSM 5078]GKX56222.1 curli assembly protein CsgE [Leminorella grimontii]VFS60944.1 curli assembly protein CsgE [Leminorella grimontii]
MKRRTLFAALGAAWILSPSVKGVEVEIPGLLTDHTVSSIGHGFYRSFSDKWDVNFKGNITITERPSARWGSWIMIKIDQDLLYQTFLFPTRRDFEKNVQLAVNGVAEKLQRRQIDKALLNTGDLTSDEF